MSSVTRRTQVARSTVAGRKPSNDDPGTLFWNTTDRRLWGSGIDRAPLTVAHVLLEFDTAKAYEVDDLVIRDTSFHRALVPKAPGDPWVPADWENVSAASTVLTNPSTPAQNTIEAGADFPALTVKLIADQISNVFEVKDTSDTTLLGVTAEGGLHFERDGSPTTSILRVDAPGGGLLANLGVFDTFGDKPYAQWHLRGAENGGSLPLILTSGEAGAGLWTTLAASDNGQLYLAHPFRSTTPVQTGAQMVLSPQADFTGLVLQGDANQVDALLEARNDQNTRMAAVTARGALELYDWDGGSGDTTVSLTPVGQHVLRSPGTTESASPDAVLNILPSSTQAGLVLDVTVFHARDMLVARYLGNDVFAVRQDGTVDIAGQVDDALLTVQGLATHTDNLAEFGVDGNVLSQITATGDYVFPTGEGPMRIGSAGGGGHIIATDGLNGDLLFFAGVSAGRLMAMAPFGQVDKNTAAIVIEGEEFSAAAIDIIRPDGADRITTRITGRELQYPGNAVFTLAGDPDDLSTYPWTDNGARYTDRTLQIQGEAASSNQSDAQVTFNHLSGASDAVQRDRKMFGVMNLVINGEPTQARPDRSAFAIVRDRTRWGNRHLLSFHDINDADESTPFAHVDIDGQVHSANGATFSGPVTSITVVDGIVTAVS